MAMDWTVNFYKDSKGKEPVKEFFLSLSDEGSAKVLKLLGMVKTYGVLLKEPYTRQVKDKIRELRTNDKQGEIRILYFAYIRKDHCFAARLHKEDAKNTCQ